MDKVQSRGLRFGVWVLFTLAMTLTSVLYAPKLEKLALVLSLPLMAPMILMDRKNKP
jgi:hypothetical protein